MVLGVDSVTDVVVVGSGGREPIGEGPGKGGGTTNTGCGGAAADRSEPDTIDRAEGLDTEDSGDGTCLIILVVGTGGILSMSEGELTCGSGAEGMAWTISSSGGTNSSTGGVMAR